MATKEYNFTTNTTVDLGVMVNPVITCTGTWGSGTVVLNVDGVRISDAYTANFYGELIDTSGRAMKISATMTGGTAQDLDLTCMFVREQGRAVS